MTQENLQQAVEYLQGNRERHPQEALREQLQKAGYSDDVVNKAFQQVFQQTQQESGRTGFFDFVNKRAYRSAGERIIDLIVGIVAAFLIGFVLQIFTSIIGFSLRGLSGSFVGYTIPWVLSLGVYIVAIVYLWNRRRFIAIGVLSSVLVSVLLVVVLFAFLFVAFRGFF